MSWFSRKRTPDAIEILSASTWHCVSCNEAHEGMFHLAANSPDPWRNNPVYEENCELRLEGDFLSEDFCVMDSKYFFARCVLEIPITGMDKEFGFGCWSTLARPNFDIYTDGFDDSEYSDFGPWFGWLCNQFYDYIGTEPVGCSVNPQTNRQRPKLLVNDENHPLAIAQRNGISAEHVLNIYSHYGHAPEGWNSSLQI